MPRSALALGRTPGRLFKGVERLVTSGRSVDALQRLRPERVPLQTVYRRQAILVETIVSRVNAVKGHHVDEAMYSRIRSLIRRAVSDPSTISLNSPQPIGPEFLSRLHAGLRYEAARGLCNSQGKTKVFHEFAAEQFLALKASCSAPDELVQFHRILAGFQRYPKLDWDARKSLITRANAAVRGPHLSFPEPAVTSASAAARAEAPQAAANRVETASALPEDETLPGRDNGGPSPTVPASAIAFDGAGDANEPLKESAAGVASESRREDHARQDLASDGSATTAAASQAAEESRADDEDSLKARLDGRKLRASYYAAALSNREVQKQLQELQIDVLGGQQRTPAWHKLRDGRLTASAFSNALGFWQTGRQDLWEEKLGLREKFAGNAATRWGTTREDEALQRYTEVTGHDVQSRGFKILGDSLVTSWLGASPDGLIEGMSSSGSKNPGGKRLPQGAGPGVLEIKCPFNNGQPLNARPYDSPPYYYMPQVQGLMELFDREWCNVFSYTVKSAALYHIRRDRSYWRDTYNVLADFWWCHIVPAKHALADGDTEAAMEYRPETVHDLTANLKARSQEMALNATTVVFPAKPSITQPQ